MCAISADPAPSTGTQCDVCADNYYGDPEVPGGSCQPCDCSNNVDPARPGNCDPSTGECLQCLFNTAGFACERCGDGFYGDAVERTCQGEPAGGTGREGGQCGTGGEGERRPPGRRGG